MSETNELAKFTEWFVQNYPGPDTIIHDPKWHAPRVFRAAKAALLSRPKPEGVEELANWLDERALFHAYQDKARAKLTRYAKAATLLRTLSAPPQAQAPEGWPTDERIRSIAYRHWQEMCKDGWRGVAGHIENAIREARAAPSAVAQAEAVTFEECVLPGYPGSQFASAPAEKPKEEPIAWMWQHGETGMTGFVENASKEDLAHWERINKPRKIIAPLYASPKSGEDEARDALDEIVNYRGGADSALDDPYVMERARAPEAGTPLTDALEESFYLPGAKHAPTDEDYHYMAKHARTLERQLAARREELDTAQRWRERHCRDAEAAGIQSGENWQKWKAAEKEAAALRTHAPQEARTGWRPLADAPRYVYGRDALLGQWDGARWKKVTLWEPEWTRDDSIARGATHWWPQLPELPAPPAAEEKQG